MKRVVLFIMLFAAMVAFADITAPKQAIAAATPPPVAVVIIACTGAPTSAPPVPYTVASVDGSSGSPTITPGSDCAGAVASTKSVGFWIRRIVTSPQDTSLVFIMVNTKDE